MTSCFHTLGRLIAVVALPLLVSCGKPESEVHGVQGPHNIRGLSYDWESRDLTVRFAGGYQYRYADIAPETFERFKTADDPQAFYERRLRGRAVFSGHEGFEVLDTADRDLEELAYHAPSRVLLARFNRKSMVEYRDVTKSDLEALLSADSLRDHLSRKFRRNFPAHRL